MGRNLIFEAGELMMPTRFRIFVILIFSILLLGVPFPSQGEEKSLSKEAGTAKEVGKDKDPATDKDAYDIEARELSYNQETDIYTAVGEVVIKKGGRILKCDYAEVNQKTMIAYARGNVEFIAEGDELRGDELTFDLNKHTGEVKKGRLFLKKNNFHVTGEQMWKTGESTYRVQNGIVTSCDGENVPWAIKAKEFQVTLEGYGQVWHSSFRIKDVPVLYFPYMIFPAKTKRQSGLLMPEPGFSTRDGLTFNLPFFWAISDNTDATFNEYFMSRRGFIQGTEFRYALSPFSKGTLMLDYLFKDWVSQEEKDKGNISEAYSERYWFRSKINQKLPWNVDLKMDLDLISDQDYLKEFRGTPSGLDRNRRTFLTDFSRDLDDETQIDRRNTAVFTRNFGSYNLTGGFTFYEELDKTNDALNQLPYLRFDGIKQVLWKNLYYQWGSSYNSYWREKLDRGNVIDLTPNLYYPFKLKNYFNLEGSVGLTETLYQVDNKLKDSVDSFGTRTVPYVRLDMSTDIQKIFELSGEGVQKIKHNIRPQIIYNYTPEINQDSLPSFVSPLGKVNTVTYYLINTFTAKSLLGKGGKGEDLFGYRDFAQFKFYQTYNLNAAQDGTTTTTYQPFSDIYAEMELAPWPYLTLRSTLGWSPYTNQIDSQSYILTFLDKKGSRAYVEYLATSGDQYRQINANLTWRINPVWSADFLTRYSLDQNKNYETKVGVSYTQQCWGIKLSYSETPDDKQFTISFSLKGLGEF